MWHPFGPARFRAGRVLRQSHVNHSLTRRANSTPATAPCAVTRLSCHGGVTGVFFRKVPMLYVTREEFRTAATTLGFNPATLRQWRHRR